MSTTPTPSRQTKSAASRTAAKTAASKEQLQAPHYRVEIADLHAHLYRVTLRLAQPQAEQVLRLPVWIPGSYLVREFSKHLQKLRCTQGKRSVACTQLDKASWRVECKGDQALEVQYEIYAFDDSVRTAWLDTSRAFFNGSSLFLQALGFDEQPCHVEIVAHPDTPDWAVATALSPVRVNKKGFGSYVAQSYDTLVDCPVEIGAHWSGSFSVYGIPHRFVVAGATPNFDGERLLADSQAICEAAMRFWHGANTKAMPTKATTPKAIPSKAIPFTHYLFMLNAVADGYGGLEHRNSTALICTRKDLPRKHLSLSSTTTLTTTAAPKQAEGYSTLLGLISHEYFHTWNVKRLRPAEFTRYDYAGENYTKLLWFFEGFTSYYDDMLLRRAKRIDNATYLQLLARTINQVQQTPGRLVQSVAQASFDAWIKYYRPDENTPNATVSYYTKGSLVALCLDLHLRCHTSTTLDAVMRGVWQRCQGGPMTEADLLEELQQQSQRSYAQELARWVHSTAELELAPLLESHGVQWHNEPDQLAQQLGLRVKESNGLTITHVLRGGVAEKAGFAAGDEWLAVQDAGARNAGVKNANAWRMQTLDDLLLYCAGSKKVLATVSRNRKILPITLTLPKPSSAVRLSVKDSASVNRWLDEA